MAKTAAERKRDQREREAARLKELGATEIKLTLYSGTSSALERIMASAGFEEAEEAITVLIHNAERLINRDSHEFKELTKIPGRG